MPRNICTLNFCFSLIDDLDPVYFMLLWVFVGGKMLDEERMEFELMQARLIESEDRMRHFETLVRNRDQELTKTKRVSTLTCTESQVSRSLCVCVHICANSMLLVPLQV
jgi:hypothetical protein